MDKNGLPSRSVHRGRPHWNVSSSNSWSNSQRPTNTVNSNQSSLPGFLVNGRPKCLSDPLTRHRPEGVESSSLGRKPPLPGRSLAFCQPAGVTTIDQNMRQKKAPWIGDTFLSRGSKKEKTEMNFARKFLSRRTPKIESLRGSDRMTLDGERSEMDIASDDMSSMGLYQRSSCMDHEKLHEKLEQSKQRKVVLLTDHSLKRMRETSNIYLDKNRAFHKQRLKKIETNIGNKHQAQINRQLTEVEQVQEERYKRSIQNMKELANVRNRFWKEKKRRVRNTYVSVAALEMPEVDRYAYGLPADGKEYTISKKKTVKIKSDPTDKWNLSMQKARSIVKVLALREKVERTMTLPVLKPLTSHRKRKKDVNKVDCLEENVDFEAEKNEDRILEFDEEHRTENDEKFAESNVENSISAIQALIEVTSEISSLHETTTDMDTDFEDL